MCVLTIQKKIKSQRYEYFIRIFEYILILPKKFLIQKYKITSLDEFSTYMFAIYHAIFRSLISSVNEYK